MSVLLKYDNNLMGQVVLWLYLFPPTWKLMPREVTLLSRNTQLGSGRVWIWTHKVSCLLPGTAWDLKAVSRVLEENIGSEEQVCSILLMCFYPSCCTWWEMSNVVFSFLFSSLSSLFRFEWQLELEIEILVVKMCILSICSPFWMHKVGCIKDVYEGR